ncbi:leucine-rich repeat domain-containing protein [Aeoliella mucimassa]|uniref:Leucine Rich repeats (2 copies) n=1 Tax=Aeoliella mucimassa TaxID=2527972 RepID=A0A518AIZ1_9BACT|nr:hypothetical protein [Aeoliella mucimassa]QDU54644.1 hypothetical protein Pan181_08270 [Aeoliella mucimassa]
MRRQTHPRHLVRRLLLVIVGLCLCPLLVNLYREKRDETRLQALQHSMNLQGGDVTWGWSYYYDSEGVAREEMDQWKLHFIESGTSGSSISMLGVYGKALNEKDVRTVLSFQDLRGLRITPDELHPYFFEQVGSLHHLEYLMLSGTPATGTELSGLKQTNLRILDLCGSPISDKGLEVIAQIETLETLLIEKTNVTDQGLVHLKWCRNLRLLQAGGSKVTQEGVQLLRSTNPSLEVEL